MLAIEGPQAIANNMSPGTVSIAQHFKDYTSLEGRRLLGQMQAQLHMQKYLEDGLRLALQQVTNSRAVRSFRARI